MKKLFLLGLVALTFCSDGTINGVDQDFVRDKFGLSATVDKAVIDVQAGTSCPIVEFSANNQETFQIRRSEGDPPLNQSTFSYHDDQYSQDGSKQILRGSNDSDTTYEITFLGDTYTIKIDYACTNSTNDSTCVTTHFNCSGPLQK